MDPAPDPAIALRDVHLARGAAGAVLRGVDLSIATGETIALVGRSGAGKSTLLKLINGLLRPDRGDVLVEGRETGQWDPFTLRRRIGYVLQEVGLFPAHAGRRQRRHRAAPSRLGCREDLEPHGRRADAGRARPGTYRGRWPDELSGGQRQRVGVARALAADPPFLLMDEPFGALDPVTRAELHREFRRIQAEVRKTVVIVTHDMGEAFALASRVGVLADGMLAQIAAPRELAKSTDPRVRPLLEPLFEAGALAGSRA